MKTTAAITEALDIIATWNKNWKPKCFIVDNCQEEIDSIEHVFPGKYKNTILIYGGSKNFLNGIRIFL